MERNIIVEQIMSATRRLEISRWPEQFLPKKIRSIQNIMKQTYKYLKSSKFGLLKPRNCLEELQATPSEFGLLKKRTV